MLKSHEINSQEIVGPSRSTYLWSDEEYIKANLYPYFLKQSGMPLALYGLL